MGLASVCYAVTLQIQGLVVLTNPNFAFQGWHASLMTIAVALCAVFFNTVLVEALPTLEFVMLVLRKYGGPLVGALTTDKSRLCCLLCLHLRARLHGSQLDVRGSVE